jgi:hypothetical protein
MQTVTKHLQQLNKTERRQLSNHSTQPTTYYVVSASLKGSDHHLYLSSQNIRQACRLVSPVVLPATKNSIRIVQ